MPWYSSLIIYIILIYYNQLDIDKDEKEELIESLIEKKFSEYEDEVCYEPRRIYVERAMLTDKEPEVLSLIAEIEEELKEEE